MSDFQDQQLLEIFREEAISTLERLTQTLVQLESTTAGAARDKLVREIFRLAHTLKGAASTVGRGDLADISHALESRLDAVRKGAEAPTRALVDAALAAVDVLTTGIDGPLSPDQVASQVRQLTSSPGDAGPPKPAVPASPPTLPADAPHAPEPRAPLPPSDHALLEGELLGLMVAVSGLAQGKESLPALREHLAKLQAHLPRGVPFFEEVAAALSQVLGELQPGRPAPRGLVENALIAVDFLQTALGPVGASEDEAKAVFAALTRKHAVKEASTAADAVASSLAPPTEASVRIPVSLLDSILYRLDELVAIKLRIDYQRRQIEEAQESLDASVSRTRASPAALLHEVEAHRRSLEDVRRNITQDAHQLGLVAQELQEDVKEVRMVPVGPLLNPLRRTVRDLAHSLGKDALLELEGEEVRVDKRLLELIRDPITHLIRNAVDHGLEMPEERLEAGKPAQGNLKISAVARESQVWIEIRDDGRGISPSKVRASAVAKGLVDEERAHALTDREVLNFIFEPGFSTAAKVTEVSGRGVGLDVVRENVAALGGRIEFFSTEGKGTEFKLSLPLTLAASRGLVVVAGGETFCIPLTAVEEVVVLDPGEVGVAQGHLALQWRKQAVAYIHLGALLSGHAADRPPFRLNAVILAISDRRLAVGVDELLGQEEVVVKGLAPGTPRLPFVAGATSLADGRLVTVLEPSTLMESAAGLGIRGAGTGEEVHAPATVLVADDALTSRTMIASVLERAGYRTLLATDGANALNVLRREKIDLLVSDVEMPGMDGFVLVRQVRGDRKLGGLPCILVTSFGSPEDRARGAASGADGYLVKRDFEPQRLIAMVADLLGRSKPSPSRA